MHEPKHDPWPFVVLAVLIVLGIAATLYLAARLMVAPQLGETVTVTPTPQPSASAQKEEEPLFFPWNSYTPDMVQGSLRPDHEAEYRAWHKENLVAVPEILGFSGMEAWADQEQAVVSGLSQQTLEHYLDNDTPLVAWATLDYSLPLHCDGGWYLADGSFYTSYCNLHCVVVLAQGENGYLTANPLTGWQWVERAQFWTAFDAMGAVRWWWKNSDMGPDRETYLVWLLRRYTPN